MKPLYNRICSVCGILFQSPQRLKQLCPSCATDARRRTKMNYAKSVSKETIRSEDSVKPVLSISDICRIQKQYYEKYKTFLHYGDVVEQIRTGKIKIKVTKSGVELWD